MKLLISGQKAEIASLERRLKDRDEAFERQIIRLDDLEQYTRRTNIRVENIPFSDGETNDELRTTLKATFSAQGIVLDDRDISRHHRVGKPRINDDGTRVKQCIVQLANRSAREKFVGYNKKAKKTPSQVNNDLTKRRLDLLALARRQIQGRMVESGFREEQLRGKNGMQIPDEDNVFAYCNINSELRIRAKKSYIVSILRPS